MWNLIEKIENSPNDIVYTYTHDKVTNFDDVWSKIKSLVLLTQNRRIKIDSIYFIPPDNDENSEPVSVLNPTSWNAFIQEESFMDFLKDIVGMAYSVGINGYLISDEGDMSTYELIFFSAEEKELKESTPKIALVSETIPLEVLQQFVDMLN